MFKIYPYKVGSKSVRKLKDALDGLIIRTENSRYRYRPGHVIINWGNSRRPEWMVGTEVNDVVLNSPEAVALAANKLSTLSELSEAGVPTVPFTTIHSLAEEWLDDGHKVFVRDTLTGHSGEGITVVEPEQNEDAGILQDIADDLRSRGHDDLASMTEERINLAMNELPYAPLYTCAVANSGEYRVHVFDGEVILYQKKSRRVDEDGNVVTAEGEEADVRNLASNWVYRTGNLRRLERIEALAIDAISALGLDFGAVDIIKDNNGDVFVLEVNTAPGLGNTDTLEAYTEAFNSLV